MSEEKKSLYVQERMDRFLGRTPPLPLSDYVQERMDRLLGKTPPLPLSDYAKEKIAAMKEKGLINSSS